MEQDADEQWRGGEVARRVQQLCAVHEVTVREVAERVGMPARRLKRMIEDPPEMTPGMAAAILDPLGLPWMDLLPREKVWAHVR